MITSVNNAQVVEWAKLKQTKYQKRMKQFIVEERLIIDEAIKAGFTMTTIALADSGIEADYYVTDNVMKKLSTNVSLNKLIAIIDFKEQNFELGSKIVYLDNIQDPGNVGTIIRTAYSFGYTSVVCNKGVSQYNAKLISASKGAIFHINVIEDLDITSLKAEGYKIIGTMLDETASNIDDINKSDKIVIVFGNEGSGISEEIEKELDQKVYIKMDQFDSLNVAVSAGIVLHKLR